MDSNPLYEINRTLGNMDQRLEQLFKQWAVHTETDLATFNELKRLIVILQNDTNELKTWRISINQRIAWVTAAFGVIFTGIGYVFQIIVDHLLKGWHA